MDRPGTWIGFIGGLVLGSALCSVAFGEPQGSEEPKPDYQKAKSQMDVNLCAGMAAGEADKELDRVYQAILRRYRNDADFLSKFRRAHRAWMAYRDMSLQAKYPKEDPGSHYGTSFPMCWSGDYQRMTEQRTEDLRLWLDGLEEGEACTGSMPVKGQ